MSKPLDALQEWHRTAAPVRPPAPPLLYTEADSETAHRNWKATCGPHALAAACGVSLSRVHAVISRLGSYKGWMSPTQIERALLELRKRFGVTTGLKTQALCNGINRIQWEGPWLNPGVPPRVAYRHTHWVAHYNGWVLCTACLPAEWIPVDEWRRFHLEDKPPTPFHITHHYELPL